MESALFLMEWGADSALFVAAWHRNFSFKCTSKNLCTNHA